MGWQPDLQNLLPNENYVGVDWGWWSQRYPDPQGTGHCDEHGHREVFKQIKKFEKKITTFYLKIKNGNVKMLCLLQPFYEYRLSS